MNRLLQLKNRKSIRIPGIFIAVMLLFSCRVFAEEVVIPETVTVIEEEAFAGDSFIKAVTLPEGIMQIGKRAFADTGTYIITMPDTLESIAEDAFEGIRTPMLIQADSGSKAVQFALQNNLDFRADTTCRALLIGQSAYPEAYQLDGPLKDVVTMKSLLTDTYEVTVRKDLSVEEIKSSIAKVFANADEEDISLFYYSGHGLSSVQAGMNGALVGIDYASYLSGAELRSALDEVPGRKIVLVDACYSGGLISRGEKSNIVEENSLGKESDTSENSDPAASFIQSFTEKTPAAKKRYIKNSETRTSELYLLMVSSLSTEKSWENKNGGLFTMAFAESRAKADTNNDGVVTFQECHQYTAQKVGTMAASGGLRQNVQAYPDDCYWYGMFR